MRSRFLRFTVATVFALLPYVAAAQYPQRPIQLIVPNPPGGSTDTTARIFAPKLAAALGQPVLIENRPGANGNISSELTARAAPDGHTLLLAADSQIVINPHLYTKMSVDPLKALVPVATIGTTQLVLSVNPSLPVKNFQEFIDYARRANPPLAYASIGNGSQHHLTMEILKARAGIDLLHVPYKGGGPATAAILAGEVAAMFGGNSTATLIKAGKVRALALAGTKRSTTFPELPTIGDYYPGFDTTPWLGLFAPAATPAPVLAKLRAVVNRLLAESDTGEKLRNAGGLEPYITDAEEFAALIRAQHARYAKVVKDVGAEID